MRTAGLSKIVLLLDAAYCAIVAALLVVLSAPLAQGFGVPAGWVIALGGAVALWAALVGWLGTRASLAGPLLLVACGNVLATAAILALVLSRAWDAWSLLLACTAAEVLGFAVVQVVGRARDARAAAA